MQRREREYGLTRVEVIIGILILAVVAVLLNAAITSFATPARRAEATSVVRNIVNAVKSYEADYGHYPTVVEAAGLGEKPVCVGDPNCKISVGPNRLLFDLLRAIPRGLNAGHLLNPRRTKYVEMELAKDRKNPRSGFADGSTFSNAVQGCLFDPWGHQYCVAYKTDGSVGLDLSAVYSDLAGSEKMIPTSVAVFSLGNDGIVDGKDYPGRLCPPSEEHPNDVVSWKLPPRNAESGTQ